MSEAKTDAWMPLWIGAYLADTLTFTTQQHGAYLLLLMAYWRDREPLPDNDEDLASITKLSLAEWRKVRPKLERKFQVGEGVWRHKRVEQELTDSKERKVKAVSKAQAAAEARWGKGRSIPPSNAPSSPQALHEQCPTPSPIPSSLREEGGTRKRVPTPPKPEGVTDGTWADWLQLRKAKKAPVTPTVVAQAQAEAEKAGMPLQRFLEVWCMRGSQGLHADWLRADERSPRQGVAGVTVPGRDGPDPALQKIIADASKAVKPPASVREAAERMKRGEVH